MSFVHSLKLCVPKDSADTNAFLLKKLWQMHTLVQNGGFIKSFFGGIFENLEKGTNLICWHLGLQNITVIFGNVYFIELVVLFMFI